MNDNVAEWLEYADRDFVAAETLVDKEYLANVVLFHCQQCIEKILKALHVSLSREVPRIHSTVRLYLELPIKIKSELGLPIEKLEALDDVYIDNRYPAGIGMLPQGFPSKDIALEFLNDARELYSGIKEYITMKS